MSGIFGFSGCASEPERKRTLESLSFWNKQYGAEGYDARLTDGIGIGCYTEHLSSVFPASAPVISLGGDLAVVDALLYNRPELLAALGQDAESAVSDEELLLTYVYQKGFDALADVNGDFAGAIYQPEQSRWILFRDHSGIRPLFYCHDAERFAFSTDMRGLLALDSFDAAINEEQFYLRMTGGNYLSMCETEYRNIYCIRPASWTEVTSVSGHISYHVHPYWNWGSKKIRLGSDAEYQSELRRLIIDAIQRRIDAVPTPVGCELSGGLDSSIIAILINRLCGKGLYFSWSYGEDDIPLRQGRDERKVIYDICEQENIHCQLDHRRKPSEFMDNFRNAEPPYLNTRFISHGSEYFRANGARVVFSGHGGDEGVSHRNNLVELWHHREYADFVRNIYRGTHGCSHRILRTVKRTARQIFVINRDFFKPYDALSSSRSVLSREFSSKMDATTQRQSLPFAYDPIAYIAQGGHRPRLDNCALQGAQCAMRYLFPFLDFRVLDYALSIPRAQYMHGRMDRYIYRAAFDDLMPESLRRVNYKHMLSAPDKLPDVDLQQQFCHLRDDISAFLDPSKWSDYLDLDAIKQISLPDSMRLGEYIAASRILNDLSVCCAIQNAASQAAKWRESHE